jgi:hypothetical protein
MRKVTASNYRKDPLYPAVARSVAQILQTKPVVAPVDVLLTMQRITKQQYEDWRFGRIAYLERVCAGNLEKLSRILRLLDRHARGIGLKPSPSVYCKWGKRGKRTVLRFSKSGDPNLEAAYSRHYVAHSRGQEKLRHSIETNSAAKSQTDVELEEEARRGQAVNEMEMELMTPEDESE